MLAGDIKFKDLGLLVVDEEQRFGVSHKETIKAMTDGVDVLTLTASPIPRTLEMALTGIRDLSLINTPPAARQPILTYVGEYEEAAVVEAIRRELLREGQVFFVHNWVQNIGAVAQRIRELVPEARVVIAHGQMDEGTLEQAVLDFWEKRYDVLVCTTIIESGIDMPTVNTLVVDRADRLGLGQLHQLRGRVGRSGHRAYAYLLHPADKVLSEAAYERLRTIGEQTELGSGFKIAMRDLEIRGAGNLLGRDQSGHIAAVGYDLYVQMVAEAVADMKGQPIRPAGRGQDRRPLRRPPAGRLRGPGGPAAGGLPASGLGDGGERGGRHQGRVARPFRAPAGTGRGAPGRGPVAGRVPADRGAGGLGHGRPAGPGVDDGRPAATGGPAGAVVPARQRPGPAAEAAARGPVQRGAGPAHGAPGPGRVTGRGSDRAADGSGAGRGGRGRGRWLRLDHRVRRCPLRRGRLVSGRGAPVACRLP